MKRLFAAIFAIILVFSLISFAFAESASNERFTFGSYYGFTYFFDSVTGKLVIRGQGQMPSFASQKAPWAVYADRVNQVVLSSGITSISENAFAGFANMRSVTIPATVTGIALNAFSGCTNMESVVYSGAQEVFSQFVASSGIVELSQVSIEHVSDEEIEAQVLSIEQAYNDQQTLATITPITTTAPTKKAYNKGDDYEAPAAPEVLNGDYPCDEILENGDRVIGTYHYENGVKTWQEAKRYNSKGEYLGIERAEFADGKLVLGTWSYKDSEGHDIKTVSTKFVQFGDTLYPTKIEEYQDGVLKKTTYREYDSNGNKIKSNTVEAGDGSATDMRNK